MDAQPWLSIDLLSIKPAEIDALRRFRKADFSPSDISALAEEMVYYSAILAFVSAQLREPSDSFIRFVAGEIPAFGRVTAKVVERLTPILRKALQSAIVDQVARSLDRSADMTPEPEPPPPAKPQATKAANDAGSTNPPTEPKAGVVTTPEELEANRLIVTWIRETNANAPIGYRDSKSYLTIHQDNVRKWFVRLGLEEKPMWVALRHIKPDEARRLAPGIEVAESARFGDSRFIISSLGDLPKLRTAIISAYERETARKDEGATEPSEA